MVKGNEEENSNILPYWAKMTGMIFSFTGMFVFLLILQRRVQLILCAIKRMIGIAMKFGPLKYKGHGQIIIDTCHQTSMVTVA